MRCLLCGKELLERKNSMYNLLIWGAGVRGSEVYPVFQEYLQNSRYQIAAFVDNNADLWGKEKLGYKIIGPMDVHKVPNLSGIIIGSIYEREIREQIKQLIDVPIYMKIEDLMYTRISIDISGFCNANCKWCVTGRQKRLGKSVKQQVMNYDEFVSLYEYIYSKGFIEHCTEIMLYSWGEPLLNKDYVKIIEYLARQQQTYSVSTNASVVLSAENNNAYEYCKAFSFSMPGFSQASYDRIHGFSFEKIKRNIELLTENINAKGFHGDGSISYHVYKFNVNEIAEAKRFAEKLGLRFHPYYPYFNGNSMTEEYLENRMNPQDREEAEEELFLSHVQKLLKERPADYRCYLENSISIDSFGNLVLCCASDEGISEYQWGSIYNIENRAQLREKHKEMLECSSCQKCRRLGIDYWMAYNPSYVEE